MPCESQSSSLRQQAQQSRMSVVDQAKKIDLHREKTRLENRMLDDALKSTSNQLQDIRSNVKSLSCENATLQEGIEVGQRTKRDMEHMLQEVAADTDDLDARISRIKSQMQEIKSEHNEVKSDHEKTSQRTQQALDHTMQLQNQNAKQASNVDGMQCTRRELHEEKVSSRSCQSATNADLLKECETHKHLTDTWDAKKLLNEQGMEQLRDRRTIAEQKQTKDRELKDEIETLSADQQNTQAKRTQLAQRDADMIVERMQDMHNRVLERRVEHKQLMQKIQELHAEIELLVKHSRELDEKAKAQLIRKMTIALQQRSAASERTHALKNEFAEQGGQLEELDREKKHKSHDTDLLRPHVLALRTRSTEATRVKEETRNMQQQYAKRDTAHQQQALEAALLCERAQQARSKIMEALPQIQTTDNTFQERKDEFEAKRQGKIASMTSRADQIFENKKVAKQEKLNDVRADQVAQIEHVQQKRAELRNTRKLLQESASDVRQNDCDIDTKCDDSDSASDSEADEHIAETNGSSQSERVSCESMTHVGLQALPCGALEDAGHGNSCTDESEDLDDGTASVASSHFDIFESST
eukprot:g798.t1